MSPFTDRIPRDGHGRVDPATAADCLAHLKPLISEDDFDLAVALIGIIAAKECMRGVQEGGRAALIGINEALTKPIAAAAEETTIRDDVARETS